MICSSDVHFQEDISYFASSSPIDSDIPRLLWDESSTTLSSSSHSGSAFSEAGHQSDHAPVVSPVSPAPAPELRRTTRLQGLSDGLQELHFPKGMLQQPVAVPKFFSAAATRVLAGPHMSVMTAGVGGQKNAEIPTPSTWQEALSGHHGAEWLEAMVK